MKSGDIENTVSYPLAVYIDAFYGGNQRAFADAQGVKPPQITQWLKKDFIVVNDVLYSPRRELKGETEG